MRLGGGEWLLGDSQNTRDTYCLILTTCVLTDFQLVAMDVESGGAGAYNVTPDPRNDRICARNITANARNNVVDFWNIVMNI